VAGTQVVREPLFIADGLSVVVHRAGSIGHFPSVSIIMSPVQPSVAAHFPVARRGRRTSAAKAAKAIQESVSVLEEPVSATPTSAPSSPRKTPKKRKKDLTEEELIASEARKK